MNIRRLELEVFLTQQEAAELGIEAECGVIVKATVKEDVGFDGAYAGETISPESLMSFEACCDVDGRKPLGRIRFRKRTRIFKKDDSVGDDSIGSNLNHLVAEGVGRILNGL